MYVWLIQFKLCNFHGFINFFIINIHVFVCYTSVLRYGPLISHWVMRFEAKHHYFKKLAVVLGNFKNICYSLAVRHQLQQCYLQLNAACLPGEEIEIGPGMSYTFACTMCAEPFYSFLCTLSY